MKKMLMILALAASTNAFATDYSCSGTEPFWGISIAAGSLTYASPEYPASIAMPILSSTDAAGAPAGLATVIKTKATTLTLVRGADCTDGMSEEKYTHHAVYDMGSVVVYGCCNPK